MSRVSAALERSRPAPVVHAGIRRPGLALRTLLHPAANAADLAANRSPQAYENREDAEQYLDQQADYAGADVVESGERPDGAELPAEANKERVTTPYMTKYERARILGTRALQISCVARTRARRFRSGSRSTSNR